MRARTALFAAAAVAASSVFFASPASADDSSGGLSVEVIASGLDNPRGLTVRYDTLYIAQSGKGGDGSLGCIEEGPEGGAVCLGDTGKVSSLKLTKNATVKDLLTGLPSIAGAPDSDDPGGSAGGPSDVSIDGVGQVWLTIGLGGTRTLAEQAFPGQTALTDILGTEGKISAGKYVKRGDPAGFEEANDPNGDGADTNPNSLVTTGGGSVFVADSGGNSLVSVKSDGRVVPVGLFNKPEIEFPPGSGTMVKPDAVPTSVTRGPDGAFYIGELTGFPFAPGTANVYKIRAGGSTVRTFATGFTNVMDLAVLPTGEVLVLEIFADGLLSGGPGALKKVSADGKTVTTLIGPETGTLIAPGGLALDSTGKYAYISNLSVAAGAGQILRVQL